LLKLFKNPFERKNNFYYCNTTVPVSICMDEDFQKSRKYW